MAAIRDKYFVDFSGGVRNDKSDLTKKSNELVKVVNFDFDQDGKARKRLGSRQMGNTGSGDIENSVYWERRSLGNVPSAFLLVNDNSSSGNITQIQGSTNTVAITTSSTSIAVQNSSNFAASGSAEIDGDLFTYTGNAAGSLTGVTGLTSDHAANTPMHQRSAVTGGTSINGTSGVYYASLNNLLFINGRGGSGTFDGTSITLVSDTDEPAGIFATTYRQRIYVAGDGTADANGTRNGARNRVSFSQPGDATNWGDYTTDFFDVEDDRGEEITGLTVSAGDELLIFKYSSFFAYNEVSLKQRSWSVGAYNHKVIQRIGNLIYTFCPAGIFITNGVTFEKISDPVQDYIKDFVPNREANSSNRRVIENTFATVHDNKYYLYIGDISNVDSLNDVVLVYDTDRGSWTVYTGFTDFQHLKGLKAFYFGESIQKMEGLFGGDASGKYYRFFSKKFTEDDAANQPGAPRNVTGGELFEDLFSDTGTTIEAYFQTKFYDLDSPNVLKQFKYLRVFNEDPGFHISYRLEGERGYSDWKSLGTTTKPNQRLRLPTDAVGYRIALRVAHVDSNSAPVFNGFVFEETEGIGKR